MTEDLRSIQRALEEERLPPEEALAPLALAAHDAPTLGLRVGAFRLFGALAGRAYGASWEVAERAAFARLEAAREVDAPAERAALLRAMGLGFRNLWLLPYVHSRLTDDDESVVLAAISAAGGLAFPALEEAITSVFLRDEASLAKRLHALAALGRMGAESAAARIAPFVRPGAEEAPAALAALTEIRSRAGEAAALDLLANEPPRDVLLAAVRYLAELGNEEVLRALRRLARDDDADLRIAAGQASRAFKAERAKDPDERILAALTERDRAVRASLARRLRTLPVADVLEQAELLLADDPGGVVQIVAEVRAPEVTRLLLRVASDEGVDVFVRARAAGSIEANEEWERDALVLLVRGATDATVRAAGAQTIGAFATTSYVLEHLTPLADDAAPSVRAALLWALQLAARPGQLGAEGRTRAEALVRRALADPEPAVRRRAAYVAGNLDLAALVPDLVKLAKTEPDRPDARVAAFVALGEIGAPSRLDDLVFLWNREDDPQALGAASRAIERAFGATAHADLASSPPSLDRLHDRLRKLLGSKDARMRAAAARVAGLTPGAVSSELIAGLLEDHAPRVREQAVVALGRIGGAVSEPALVHALVDADTAIRERAAEALLAQGTPSGLARVLDFVARTSDRAAALRLSGKLALPSQDHDAFTEALGAALSRIGPDHPVYEPLLVLKVAALEASRPKSTRGVSVDAAIVAAFPTWSRLAAVRGFEPLAKSLRTAEVLQATTEAGADVDLSAPIVLWMKCLEGYLHAWLAPRLRALQAEPRTLWELADRVVGTAWPVYQRYLAERWSDPVKIGAMSVEVPLRSAVNALRDFQDRRPRSTDSPASVTEWGRLMLFLAVEHPSGPRNVLKLASKDADRVVRLAHRLQVLAQVRNAVTHRQVAGRETLTEFRRAYYATFEELTGMA
jgi:HEAT repeat protein